MLSRDADSVGNLIPKNPEVIAGFFQLTLDAQRAFQDRLSARLARVQDDRSKMAAQKVRKKEAASAAAKIKSGNKFKNESAAMASWLSIAPRPPSYKSKANATPAPTYKQSALSVERRFTLFPVDGHPIPLGVRYRPPTSGDAIIKNVSQSEGGELTISFVDDEDEPGECDFREKLIVWAENHKHDHYKPGEGKTNLAGCYPYGAGVAIAFPLDSGGTRWERARLAEIDDDEPTMAWAPPVGGVWTLQRVDVGVTVWWNKQDIILLPEELARKPPMCCTMTLDLGKGNVRQSMERLTVAIKKRKKVPISIESFEGVMAGHRHYKGKVDVTASTFDP